MLKTKLQRRLGLISPALVLFALFLFVIANSASAATVEMGYDDTRLMINSEVGLFIYGTEDLVRTVISAEMEITDGYVDFIFGPSPLNFDQPCILAMSWYAVGRLGLEDYTLTGPNGEEIQPVTQRWGMQWSIPHFSIYYHKRR